MTANIDWNSYPTVFPDRYLQEGPLDKYLENLLNYFPKIPIRALDIGGGIHGTKALQIPHIHAFALDPYATSPTWQTPITWETEETFHLIIARGSINYLQEPELERIPSLLEPNGIFVFNTFGEPKEIDRPFENSLSNLKGRETTTLEKIDGVTHVHHNLHLPDGNTVSHTFFHHPHNLLERIFHEGELYLQPSTNNSRLYVFTKQ